MCGAGPGDLGGVPGVGFGRKSQGKPCIFGSHHLALELVCGADFSRKLICGACYGDLGGAPGVGFGRKSKENRPEILPPDCLHAPSLTSGAIKMRLGFELLALGANFLATGMRFARSAACAVSVLSEEWTCHGMAMRLNNP